MKLQQDVTVYRGDHTFYYCQANRHWFNVDFGYPMVHKKLKPLVKQVVTEWQEMEDVFEIQKL